MWLDEAFLTILNICTIAFKQIEKKCCAIDHKQINCTYRVSLNNVYTHQEKINLHKYFKTKFIQTSQD